MFLTFLVLAAHVTVSFFYCFCFFFSSRRRHTRSLRDWSSDVCSSDLNCTSVGNLGTFEYWLSMIKVVTIVAFLTLGTALLWGVGFPKVGFANYSAHGGFLPNGWKGVGLGVVLGLFSFFGIEVVGSTAGEAADPKAAVPKALRRTLIVLVLFYVAGLALVVGIVPWAQIGLGESPFVRVFQTVGIPAASHIMNFVVLTAALSSAVANLYFAARLAFSLSRGGYL